MTLTPFAGIKVNLLSIARRFIGTREVDGPGSNPLVLWMLQRYAPWVHDDAEAWCGATQGFLCWLLERPVPAKPLRARSWLTVGERVALEAAIPGWDIVILARGGGPQPGPDVLDAPGHVTVYAGRGDGGSVRGVGGNQNNEWSEAEFPASRVLGVRRL